MYKFEIGDIVFVKRYTYKNGKVGNNHLFVIVSEDEAIEINYFGFLISSNIDKATYPYNKKISKNKVNCLNKESIVKCDDLIKLYSEQIQFKLGRVTEKELERFLEMYEKFLETV